MGIGGVGAGGGVAEGLEVGGPLETRGQGALHEALAGW